MAKRAEVKKSNVVLGELQVEYVGVDTVSPNKYNPNRQSDHDFELLCRSIAEDGFTQPIVVLRSTREIVDGEHRWRACKALGFEEIPVVFVNMTPEQMRIATLRHNRARGTEDADLAGQVLKDLAALGAVDWAADSLMMDDVEVKRLLEDMGDPEVAKIQVDVPEEMLGPSGRGLSEVDKSRAIDHTSDETRAKQRLLDQAKQQEVRDMAKSDQNVYRLVLFFSGDQAKTVKAALERGEGNAKNVLALCKEAASRAG